MLVARWIVAAGIAAALSAGAWWLGRASGRNERREHSAQAPEKAAESGADNLTTAPSLRERQISSDKAYGSAAVGADQVSSALEMLKRASTREEIDAAVRTLLELKCRDGRVVEALNAMYSRHRSEKIGIDLNDFARLALLQGADGGHDLVGRVVSDYAFAERIPNSELYLMQIWKYASGLGVEDPVVRSLFSIVDQAPGSSRYPDFTVGQALTYMGNEGARGELLKRILTSSDPRMAGYGAALLGEDPELLVRAGVFLPQEKERVLGMVAALSPGPGFRKRDQAVKDHVDEIIAMMLDVARSGSATGGAVLQEVLRDRTVRTALDQRPTEMSIIQGTIASEGSDK